MKKTCALILLTSLVVMTSPSAAEKVDLRVIHRIKEEAFRHSQVMDHLFHLADLNGPRLTGSEGFKTAAAWAVRALGQWGIRPARTETWGEFGQGWSLRHFSARMEEPVYAPLPGIPKAWTQGTHGPVSGPLIYAPLFETFEDEVVNWDLDKLAAHEKAYVRQYQGKLRGKIVLLDRLRELSLPLEAAADRLDGEGLQALGLSPDPVPPVPYQWPLSRFPVDRKARRKLFASIPMEVAFDFFSRRSDVRDILNRFLRDEGVLAVLETDRRGQGGIAFAEGAGNWRKGRPLPPPVIALPPEPYSRLIRLVKRDVPVKVALDLAVHLDSEPQQAANVIGEIRGRDRASGVVMLGAHLDSWHGGTGATDNGAGSAVAMEALRILKALDLPMKRTVRLALWSGEEQGLLGSRAYVKKHFADPVSMKLNPEHARLSGYFNLDNGSGRIRGVYLQGNDMMRPLFKTWLAPFADLGVTTISIRKTGGTDHLSFDAVGLPGFQFIQDPLDYASRTHHSNMDLVDHIQEADLMQASAVLAAVVYQAASREEMLPRKPLPDPLPAKSR